MNISNRDRQTLIYGGAAALLIVVVGYVIVPMRRSWGDTDSSFAARQEYVASLKKSISQQEATLKQRNALAMRLGSLFVPREEAPDKSAKDKAAPPAALDAKPESDGKGPGSPPASPPPQAGSAPVSAPQTPAVPGGPGTVPAPQPTAAKPDSAKPAAGPRPPGQDSSSASEGLAGYLEQNAKKAGVTLKRVAPQRTVNAYKGGTHFRPVTLQVKLECNIQSLVSLLTALEKGQQFVKVEDLQLRRDLAKGDNLDVTMELRSYEAVARPS